MLPNISVHKVITLSGTYCIKNIIYRAISSFWDFLNCFLIPQISGGLTQTLPSHIEGWFSNKLSRLKNLSEIITDSRSKQKDSNLFSNSSSKNRSKIQPVKKRVCVIVGNIPLENILDLSEFNKVQNNETSPCLVSEMAIDVFSVSSKTNRWVKCLFFGNFNDLVQYQRLLLSLN